MFEKYHMHPDHRLPEGASLEESGGARLGCFAPTHAVFNHLGSNFAWSSRYHRKGRYPTLRSTPHKHIRRHPPRLLPIWFGYPLRDISYWVAFVFTLGCVAWVVNGHYALWSNGGAVAASEEAALKVAAIAALIGGTLFEVGSWLLYWEALNPEHQVLTGKDLQPDQTAAAAAKPAAAAAAPAGDQGYHLTADVRPGPDHRAVSVYDRSRGGKTYVLSALDNKRARFLAAGQQQQQQQQRGIWHHGKKTTAAAAAGVSSSRWPSLGEDDVEAPRDVSNTSIPAAGTLAVGHYDDQRKLSPAGSDAYAGTGSSSPAVQQQQWRWFGFRFHDIGFMASFLQLIGATIFWVPCIFGAPGVYPTEDSTNYKAWDGVYWLLQVVGASFFIISSLLFMLEVQPAWYKPKPLMIGWHVGFWNFIGAAGFWLSGFFGFWEPVGQYQLSGVVLSTFWGSYAFLIGSYLQLIESVNKHTESLSMSRAPKKR